MKKINNRKHKRPSNISNGYDENCAGFNGNCNGLCGSGNVFGSTGEMLSCEWGPIEHKIKEPVNG